jgi:transposase
MKREEILAVYEQGPEAVVQLVTSLFQIIEELKETVKQQGKRISDLENRLAKDSRNSSKPPSTDGFRKTPKSLRSKSNKKSGGQNGHPGTTLRMVADPDEIRHLPLVHCQHCGHHITDSAKSIEKRQVFEIPELKIKSTEYQAEYGVCSHCGKQSRAEFPAEASQKVQYGPKFRSLLVYLNQYQLLPYARVGEFFVDIFNWKVSEGTLNNTIKSCYEKLESTEEAIKKQLRVSGCVGFDESGAYVNGDREWFHVASAPNLTWYGVHKNRGLKAMDCFGILPEFKGVAMHDFYSSYFKYDLEHVLCNAHLLRELIFEYEEMGQKWAGFLIDLLVKAKKDVDNCKEGNRKSVSKQITETYSQSFDRIIQSGLRKNPLQPGKPNQRGRPAQSSARNLLDRLKKFKGAYLMFMYDFRIPFDNNGSERDIRMLKVQQKISGCFRSGTGSEYFARIRGYISTSRKNSINVADAISGVFTGNPFLPEMNG